MNGDNSDPTAQQHDVTTPEAGSGDIFERGLTSFKKRRLKLHKHVGNLKAAIAANGSNHVNHVASGDSKSLSSPSKFKTGHSSPSKHKDGSSSSKHKDGSSSSKHKDGSSKHKDSSSSSKHKDGSSSKHKDGSSHHSSSSKSSLDKHRDGSSSKSKEGSSSKSSSKQSSSHKDHSSSKSSSSHHRHKDHKHRDKNRPVSTVVSETISVKTESLSAVKAEPDSDAEDDLPLNVAKRNVSDGEDDVAMSPMKKVKTETEEDSDDDYKPVKKNKDVKGKKRKHEDEDFKVSKKKKDDSSSLKKKKDKKSASGSPTKRAKKEEPVHEVWKWWEEEKLEDGTKWRFLEHKGPVFAPPYERLPKDVKMKYDGEKMSLSQDAEEVAGFYSKMIEHDYTTKDVFNKNFFKDWRKVMTEEERKRITDLSKCDFRDMHAYFQAQSEKRKAMSKEEKKAIKEKNEELIAEYGFCSIDGHKEKIGNFRIEPPGLFRGRGDHPKMGQLKRRVNPEDVIINCSKDAKVPTPPEGHKWKKVQHDNTVSWLASWTENVQGQVKYVMLNASSRLKGEKDWQKYETARSLHKIIDRVRATYREDWKSKEMRVRQRAVAMYFIDKLALRAGNEKETDETADTVGCCSLRVEHIRLHEKEGEKENVVEFDFLGKDSIRYQNSVSVEKRVFKNLKLFMDHKQPADDLFDRLNTAILNKHLTSIMDGLTAKVFRTYNASRTLQEQLTLLTKESDPVAAKLLSYNRANRAVAILCNHQRAAPKNFSKQMENMLEKIKLKKKAVKEAKRQVKDAKSELKSSRSEGKKAIYEKKKKMLARLEEQLTKLEVSATDKEENKEIALGTSKLNYLDPRISVAWCKKWEVPIEKIYNKTQREKFRWAIDMAGPDYEFTDVNHL